MKRTFVEKFTDILAEQGAISQQENKDLEKSFKASAKPNFVDFLLEEGLASKEEIVKALATYYRVPSFDAQGYFFDHQLVTMFPQLTLKRYGFIPIEVDEGMMLVLASDPHNPELLPIIGQSVSYDIRFRVGIYQDIIDAIDEFYDTAPTEDSYDQDLTEEHELAKEERRVVLKEEELVRLTDEQEGE